MILSNAAVRLLVEAGTIQLAEEGTPYIGAYGIVLTVGRVLYPSLGDTVDPLARPELQQPVEKLFPDEPAVPVQGVHLAPFGPTMAIPPNSPAAMPCAVLVVSREEIALPPGLAGMLVLLPEFAQLGCILHGAPVLPGANVTVQSTLVNLGRRPIDLRLGTPFAELVIARLEGETEPRPVFGPAAAAQAFGPVPPHVQTARDRYRAAHPEHGFDPHQHS